MRYLALDFETYMDSEYSLKKMTTVEYCCGDKFQTIILSWKWVGDTVTHRSIGHKEVDQLCSSIDWDNTSVIAHNAGFDCNVLFHQYGVSPAMIIDTSSMMRFTGAHLIGHKGGASLDALAKVLQKQGLNCPDKGAEVIKMSGKRLHRNTMGSWYLSEEPLADDTPEMEQAVANFNTYADYCDNDVAICELGYSYMRPMIPDTEMQYQSMILKCWANPVFKLDKNVLEEEHARLIKRGQDDLQRCADLYCNGDKKLMMTTFRSVKRFKELLYKLGGATKEDDFEGRFIIPTAKNKKGEMAVTFARTNERIMEILDGDAPDDIVFLITTKLEFSSSIELARTERFLNIAKLNVPFGMPYIPHGASSGRIAATDSLNAQNLPSGRKVGQTNALRMAITAPDESMVIVCSDSSQVEARCLSFEAQQLDLLNTFASGGDPYSVMASYIYGGDPEFIKKQAKAHVEPYSNIQRPVGKVSILSSGYGSGAKTYKGMVKAQGGVDMTLEECQQVVAIYRAKHTSITAFWKVGEWVLKSLANGGSGEFGGPTGKLYKFGVENIHGEQIPVINLPDGTKLFYKGLRYKSKTLPDGEVRRGYFYQMNQHGRLVEVHGYGAKLIQMCTQATAFALMKQQALLINRYSPVLLNTHDEWAICVPKEHADVALQYMIDCMRWTPSWAQGLPIDAEGDYAFRYGECK